MSNIMVKLIIIEDNMENLSQPATTLVNPEFIIEPLQEMGEVKVMEESLRDPDNYFQLVSYGQLDRQFRYVFGLLTEFFFKRYLFAFVSLIVCVLAYM